uniref:class I SAM-dependent methyltransferase n=1 Tax=uncultured Agrococcus sp. TaxID=382258 RepID=UPI0025F1DCD5
GLEQATRDWIAEHHAARMAATGAGSIADLGCGIGADARAFAAAGLRVHAVDADESTASLAAFNLREFPDAEATLGTAEDFDTSAVDAVWLDPARRGAHGRTPNPADWSPSLAFAFGLAATKPLGVKLGPAIPHELLPLDAEWQWVGEGNETLEAAVYWGGAERESGLRSALVRSTAGETELASTERMAPPEVTGVDDYVLEPHGAVIRAGLLPQLAEQLGATLVSDGIAYLTSTTPVRHPLVQTFEVTTIGPLKPKALNSALRAAEIGTVEIKQRGTGIDPAVFRKRLQLRGQGTATIILTRDRGEHRAVLAKRL